MKSDQIKCTRKSQKEKKNQNFRPINENNGSMRRDKDKIYEDTIRRHRIGLDTIRRHRIG